MRQRCCSAWGRDHRSGRPRFPASCSGRWPRPSVSSQSRNFDGTDGCRAIGCLHWDGMREERADQRRDLRRAVRSLLPQAGDGMSLHNMLFAAVSSASILQNDKFLHADRCTVRVARRRGKTPFPGPSRPSGSTRNGASGPVDKRSDEFDGNKSATSLEQLPPVPVRSTPSHRLDLEPFLGRAGPVGRIAALGDDAIEPVLLGLREQRSAIVEGLDQVQARDLRAADQSQQASPALNKR